MFSECTPVVAAGAAVAANPLPAPNSWRALAREQAAAFARHAELDTDYRALSTAAVELAAANAVSADTGALSWEHVRPAVVAAQLAATRAWPLGETFALLWGFFQFLSTTGRMDSSRGRFLAAYFQTLTELEDQLLQPPVG